MRKTAIESILFTKQIIGYFTITTRKGKRKRIKIYKPSPVGTPVHGHVNRRFFHRAIQYNVTPMQLKRPASAVIGPTRSRVGDVMYAHEFGGPFRGQVYQRRPVMEPAMMANLSRMARDWAGAIRS